MASMASFAKRLNVNVRSCGRAAAFPTPRMLSLAKQRNQRQLRRRALARSRAVTENQTRKLRF
jgi:hypothetical protein